MKTFRGFTLIELLVVLLIMGISAGIAVMTLKPNPRHAAQSTAAAIVQALHLAETESLLKPAVLGFVLIPCGWRFEQFTAELNHKPAWRPMTVHALSAHCIPHNVTLHLTAPQNRIMISPGGDLTPFSLLIGPKGHPPILKISGESSGEIHMEPADAR